MQIFVFFLVIFQKHLLRRRGRDGGVYIQMTQGTRSRVNSDLQIGIFFFNSLLFVYRKKNDIANSFFY